MSKSAQEFEAGRGREDAGRFSRIGGAARRSAAYGAASSILLSSNTGVLSWRFMVKEKALKAGGAGGNGGRPASQNRRSIAGQPRPPLQPASQTARARLPGQTQRRRRRYRTAI